MLRGIVSYFKMKKSAGFLLFSMLFIFSSCSTSKIQNEQGNIPSENTPVKKVKQIKYNEEDFKKARDSGDYSSCLGMVLNKTRRKAGIKDSLDMAMLYFINGDYEKASAVFEKTDNMMYDSLTKSITKTIAKTVANENLKEYTGNVYEYLLVNTMNCLCFYMQGDLTSAVNQLTKLSDLKLPEYRRMYGEVVVNGKMDPSVEEEFNSSIKSLSSYSINSSVFTAAAPKKPSEKDFYKESALARYLSLILRQADGDKSQIDSDEMVLKSLVKNFDDADCHIPSRKGRLDVLALAGLIGKQSSRELYFPSKSTFFYVPTGTSMYRMLPVQFKFVHPVYEKKSFVTGVDVVLNNVGTKKTIVIENFNTDLEKAVKLKAYKEYGSSMTRSITKKVSGIVAGIAGINASYTGLRRLSRGSVAYTLSSLAFNALCESTKAGLEAIDLTETADIRQGEFFPESANAAGFTVPAGVYSGKVIYRFENGTKVEKKFEAEVREGKPTLVVSSCF